jgi:hypothetical protein
MPAPSPATAAKSLSLPPFRQRRRPELPLRFHTPLCCLLLYTLCYQYAPKFGGLVGQRQGPNEMKLIIFGILRSFVLSGCTLF